MRKSLPIISVVIVLSVTLYACATPKSIQATEQTQQLMQDKSLSELVRSEVERQIASVRQTVVEYYPPSTVCSVDTLSPRNREPSGPKPKKPPDEETPQAIKSITTTEVLIESGKVVDTAASNQKDIVQCSDTDNTVHTKEKPSNATVIIKWIGIIFGILLIITIILKFF